MKTKSQIKTAARNARHARIRARVIGSAARPRLAIFRSNTGIYAQLIDDSTATTLVATDSRKIQTGVPREKAAAVGTEIAKLAKEKGIDAVVFDRGGYPYRGSVAALAEAAREEGLSF